MVRGVFIQRAPSERLTFNDALDHHLTSRFPSGLKDGKFSGWRNFLSGIITNGDGSNPIYAGAFFTAAEPSFAIRGGESQFSIEDHLGT